MEGLTCALHGEFKLCRHCKAPQLESHKCLQAPQAKEAKAATTPKSRDEYKKKGPYRLRTDETNGVCCICGKALAKRGPQGQLAEFCMAHQKYKHRVLYYMKRASKKLSKDDAMTKVIKEAKEERRIQHMLSGQEGSEIVATSQGVDFTARTNTNNFVGPPGGHR